MTPGRLLALLFAFSAPAAAQRAYLYGHILDPSGLGIPDAAVTVTSQDTGFRRFAQTEPSGAYSIGSLQSGSYKIMVRKEGFVTLQRFGLHVEPETPARADFTMPVGSIEESITVEGGEMPLERTDPSTGGRVEREEIDRIPLNGRGLLTLLEFIPGTNVIPATRGEAGQFTATGQRPNTNYFTIDGVSANTGVSAGGIPAQSTGGSLPALSAFGSMDSLISLDAVERVRVRTSTSVAEFGRLPGAAVALTSRSGGNEFHGSAGYRIRNEFLNANDWFGNQAGFGRLPLRMQDVSAALGGPIRRNRTFLFVSYQHISLRQPYVWRQPVPSEAARQKAGDWAQPLLSFFPAATGSALSGGVGDWVGRSDRPAGLDTGGVRIDQAIGSRVSIFGRYNDSPSNNQFGVLGTNRLDLRSQSLTLSLNARPTPNLTLDTRANESQSGAHSLWALNGIPSPGCELQPVVAEFLDSPAPCSYLVRFSIGGVGQVVSGHEGDRRQRQFQLLESVSLHRGGHSVQVGADYRTIVAIRRDPTGALGLIADAVPDLTDRRNLWVAKSSAQNGTARVKELSLWVQDTWQLSKRLTIAAGLRWEFSPAPLSTNPTYFLNTKTNTPFPQREPLPLWTTSYSDFAPRLGVAWRITADGKTVLRAGGGLYYDSSMSIAADILNGGPLSVSSFTSGKGGLFSAELSFGFMPGLRLPQVSQWNLSVERALGTRDVLSLGYVGSEGHYLIRREVGGAGSTPLSPLALTTNHGASDYHGLQAQYQRQVAQGLQISATYTWSHSIDNDSSDAFLLWAGSPASDRGSSDFDLRQAMVASASYEFPKRSVRALRGWALDLVFRARSGFPVTVQQAEQYQGITLLNAFRPNLALSQPLWLSDPATPGGRRLNPAAFLTTADGVQGLLGRNAITGFGMSQFDLSIRREFRLGEKARLQFRAEAFNALNHPNFADPIRYLNSPVFGQSTSMLNLMLGTGSPGSGLSPILQTGGPRSLRGGLRFQF